MCALSQEQSILSRKTLQNAFNSELCPFFDINKTSKFCNISVLTEDIYLKLRVAVHFSKINPYYRV